MSRVWIIRAWCVLFALVNAPGAHAHRLASAHAPDASEASAQLDLRHSNHHAHDLRNAVHEHLHAAHGAVDVDAPAKAFSKTPVSKTELFVLAFTGIFLLLVRRASRHTRRTQPVRPSLPRWHSWYLPPTQAPPLTA